MSIDNLVLKALPLTTNKVAGVQALHDSNKSKFQYAIDCTVPTIFNLAEAMKVNMKRQLSKAKGGNLK